MSKKDKQLLRIIFESWREYTVEIHASRFRKKLSLEQRGTLNEAAYCLIPQDCMCLQFC